MPPVQSAQHIAHWLHSAGAAPGARLDRDSFEVRDRLELLDDAMFAAILGDREALRQAPELWRRTVDELGWQHVEESREQYLRFAVETTRRFEWSENREVDQAMAAVEIIELLTCAPFSAF